MLQYSLLIRGKKKNQNVQNHPYTNHLIYESSPYLLQHAHNPVNWYPWGKEALAKAKEKNKLIIISIGYAACHWCHVMEHESFEDVDVANFMNDNFISIKVDREERPDIDQIYMNAVQLLTGRGGWPLNVIVLPDGRPIYGGTYFSKEQWLSVLKQVFEFVKQNPDKTKEQANALTEGIKTSEIITAVKKKYDFTADDLNTLFNHWKVTIDKTNGGYSGAPKFPLPVGYQFLLFYTYLTQNSEALDAVTTTLNKMAEGGIYDQAGGGFARYSTDAYWKVPHFEKMLYDNAQLVSVYASAYQQTKLPQYKKTVYETLEFIRRELTSKEGGFYASLDADSEGEEGKFYVWTKEEIQQLLGKNAPLFIDYFNITGHGNWENGKNILFKTTTDNIIAEKYSITETELQNKVFSAKKTVLKERANRVRPLLDDKILTSWNGLMLKGYIDAYRVFNEPKFLSSALNNAEFILKNLKSPDFRLDRNYKNGKSTINGFLDDYAFTIDAFIALYQATFIEKYLLEAKQLAAYTLVHFYDTNSGMFFYTSDEDPVLIARKMELTDNVIPAANSTMAKNLYVLGHYFSDQNLIDKSLKMLINVKKEAEVGGVYYANWDILMVWFVSKPYEVAIVGKDYVNKRKEFDTHYLPNVFLSGGNDKGTLPLLEEKLISGQTTIYVCRDKTCKLPVKEVNEAISQINGN
ncbi:MAG: thioredoxin domain-containing protein [Bacteroidales bacterium]|nr:thioredoxin domain-containing protein [Bacteroidales bacterium]